MLRHGQWILFDGVDIPGAHRAPSGKLVGIWQHDRVDAVSGHVTLAHVVPVDPDGKNIRLPVAQFPAGTLPPLAQLASGKVVEVGTILGMALVTVPPEFAQHVEPVLDAADLPPGRMIHGGPLCP